MKDPSQDVMDFLFFLFDFFFFLKVSSWFSLTDALSVELWLPVTIGVAKGTSALDDFDFFFFFFFFFLGDVSTGTVFSASVGEVLEWASWRLSFPEVDWFSVGWSLSLFWLCRSWRGFLPFGDFTIFPGDCLDFGDDEIDSLRWLLDAGGISLCLLLWTLLLRSCGCFLTSNGF